MVINIALYTIATLLSFLLVFILKEERKYLLIAAIWFLLLSLITVFTEQDTSFDWLSKLLFTVATIAYAIRYYMNKKVYK